LSNIERVKELTTAGLALRCNSAGKLSDYGRRLLEGLRAEAPVSSEPSDVSGVTRVPVGLLELLRCCEV
jgi:hypothetical protein